MKPNHDRREFLQIATAGAAALVAAPAWGAESSKKGKARNRRAEKASAPVSTGGRKLPFELGLASYTCRKFDLAKTLEMTNRVGLKHIALKDVHLAMNSSPEQIQAVAAKSKAAGLDLYGGGVIYMRNEAQVNQAFDYAKAAGMRVIIGVPEPDLLPLVDKKVKEYDIKVAIHNHGPGDKVYPMPATAYEKIKDLDKRIGLCNDIGHTTRAGVDVGHLDREVRRPAVGHPRQGRDGGRSQGRHHRSRSRRHRYSPDHSDARQDQLHRHRVVRVREDRRRSAARSGRVGRLRPRRHGHRLRRPGAVRD